MSGTQVATSSSQLTYAIQGYNGINLTNWTTSAASVIAAGSGVEVAGAFFRYSSDDTNDATSFSAIATNATAYLQLVPSGTVGSQIVTSSWTSTAPTWRESLNGWYASAASSTRYVAGCVKTGPTSYELKFIITPRANIRHEQAESFTNLTATTMTVTGTLTAASAIITGAATITGVLTVSGGITQNSVNLIRKVVNIGDWNMDTDITSTVALGVTTSAIRRCDILLRDDSGSNYYPLSFKGGASPIDVSGSFRFDNFGNITMNRTAGGTFDTTSFDATSYNRGYITIEYEG